MAFTFNGNTPENITYNGENVSTLVYNNKVVWYKLPNTYQEVEYIKSTGTQYIDSGFTANQDTGFEMKIRWNAGNFIFGSDGDSSGNTNAVGINKATNSTQFRWHYDNQQYSDGGSRTYGNLYEIFVDKNKMYLDGVLTTTFNYENFSTPSSVIISGIRRGTTINMGSYGSSLEIYNFKIYDNGVPVRWFIPCYRISDTEIGLYDVINGTFYTNGGTGTFEKGNDV